MKAPRIEVQRIGKRHVAALLATSAIFTAGCANMVSTATDTAAVSSVGEMSGSVHGGNQAVSGATVTLYAAGQSGAGSAGVTLATTTTSTDGTGTFVFRQVASAPASNAQNQGGNSYSCGTGADPNLYVISRGGNTVGTGTSTNSAAVFVAPIGFCSQAANVRVNISEVTTAATVAAAGQFINPSTETIGADGIAVAYVALNNAFKTVPNLVNLATGLANASTTIAPAANGASVSGVTMTATPETAKLNTIANILSSCINGATSSNANCATLFANAVPPTAAGVARSSQPNATFPIATDTLQAALYIFINPTDSSTTNRTNLYNLSPASGAPFQPTITSVPTDWTLAISYSTSNGCGSSTNPSNFFSHPYDLNLDINGNVWIANNAQVNGALVEISATGVPMACVTLGGGAKAGGLIDIAGNAWYGDNQSNKLYRYNPTTLATTTFLTPNPPLALATDAAGAIYYTAVSGTTGSVYKIDQAATSQFPGPSTQISNVVGPVPARIFPDNASNLWVTSGAGFVSQVNPAASGPNFLNNYTTLTFTVPSPSYGVVVGPANRVYVTSQDPAASLTVLAPLNGNYSIQPGFPTASNTGGLSNPAGAYIDGAQNSWIANNAAESTNGLYGVSTIALDGTAISASGNAIGAYEKSTTFLNAGRGIVVDAVGNVWETNDGNLLSVTELVGAAVPLYAPYSTGLQNGRFQQTP